MRVNIEKQLKVWDKRIFKDFDETNQLDNRGFQGCSKKVKKMG